MADIGTRLVPGRELLETLERLRNARRSNPNHPNTPKLPHPVDCEVCIAGRLLDLLIDELPRISQERPRKCL